MRKVEIPIIYSASTGEWLNVCGLVYDSNENIVRVDAWDGDGVITYEKGEFKLDESNVAPLYQRSCMKCSQCPFYESDRLWNRCKVTGDECFQEKSNCKIAASRNGEYLDG